MPIQYRLFLLSGLISILVGILQITSLLETKADGLSFWGYFLLIWGIVAFLCALNRFKIGWINNLIATMGAVIHGAVVMYSLLFPFETVTKGMSYLYPIMSFISVCCCAVILGLKSDKTHSKMISK
ncbi:hypothetical protein [Fictibacillus phosphorivorans]|uniref:hypothetical protein n=1 Tax=Fictibacillus phosphorivorans TaxID=1221500 RepID=UPI00129400B3|nr:hypothetical protein [Fictibacillus phosphorivorans]MQR96838.1 hypothetical protein [Fictibacillus phosphorivorans]